MAKLSDEAKQLISTIRPGLVATVSKDGKPNVSAKGSFRVLDDEHVVFTDVRSPRTIANLKENPQVSVLVLSPERKGCRIWGKAEILDSGDLFDAVSADLKARGRAVNHVVKVSVDEVVTFAP